MKRPSSVSSHRCPWLNRRDRGPSPSRRKADSDIVHTQTSPLLTFSPKMGCYADFTMPSAPSRGQVSKINALYECVEPLERRAPHRHGRDLARGRRPQVFPILVQGPLMLDFSRRKRRIFPALENSELSGANPPALQRLHLWQRAAITVQGCLEWLFVKLHCHGMDPRSTPALLGPPMQNFLHNLADAGRGGGFQTHFVTAREMTNLILAACDEKNGDPCMFRDYRLRPIK